MVERFNYYEFEGAVRHTALSHPLISNFYTERWKLNATDDIEYPAVVMTNNSVTVGENVTTVHFNLLYADRLTEKRDNATEIYSMGIDILTELYNALRFHFDVDSRERHGFNLFQEQFADNAAGVFTSVTLEFRSNFGACDWIHVDRNCYG